MIAQRYGSERVRRGIVHFVAGKGVSSIAGFLSMILVVRLLSIESFAAYSVLTAFVEMLTALSGFGLAHVLLRYVPELYSKHYRFALRDLIVQTTLLRGIVLVLITTLSLALADWVAPFVGLGNAIEAFQIFLLVVVLRSTTHFLSQILESTLHQGLAQTAFSATAIVRLLGMAVITYKGDTNLITVIWVEAIADSISLLVVGFGVVRVAITSLPEKEAPADDDRWLTTHRRGLLRFAAQGYLQHLAILPYGGHTNRLIGGHLLATSALANYGFAQTLYEYVKRYLPAQLLVGLIRPIVVSRYVAKKDFSIAARLCGHVVQINILLMGVGFALMVVSGPELLQFISGGKYGTDATWLLIALFFVLLLETQRQQLELLVQTIEQYQLLIPSNIFLSSSVLLAILGVPIIGAIAFPLANILGLLIANEWVRRRMRRSGAHFNLDWAETSITICITILTIVAGLLTKYAGWNWIASALITLVVYTVISYLFRRQLVWSFLNELTSKDSNGLPEFTQGNTQSKVKIAFGILSSKDSTSAIEMIAAQVAAHPVYVHHDFTKQPVFTPVGTNIIVLPTPAITAWGDWSLVEATYRLMEAALTDKTVTHFQLLSESCLLIRPISDFEDHIKQKKPDFMLDFLNMKDSSVYLSHGWRYFSINKNIMRILRRATLWNFPSETEYSSQQSINLRTNNSNSPLGIDFWIGRSLITLNWFFFQRKLKRLGLATMALGGQWFGASRAGAQWLIDARNHNKQLTQHFQRSHIPDEAFIQTLVINLQLQYPTLKVESSNHFMSWKSCGTGPDILTPQDAEAIAGSGKYFARKIPLDSDTPIRELFRMLPAKL